MAARWALTATAPHFGLTEIHSEGTVSAGDGNIVTLTLQHYLNFLGEPLYDVEIAGDDDSNKRILTGETPQQSD